MATVEVNVQIGAPPERVWQVVGNPVEMSGLTAECVEMRWVGRSSSPAVGSRFRGRNRSGWRRWSTTCTIVRYDPGSEIAWDVSFGPFPVARWGYAIEPGEGPATSTVRERFDDHRGIALRVAAPFARGTRDADGLNRANMVATLARVKARAES